MSTDAYEEKVSHLIAELAHARLARTESDLAEAKYQQLKEEFNKLVSEAHKDNPHNNHH